MKGQYLLIEAPNEREAHEDYVDCAALACACSMMETVPDVEQVNSPFYRREYDVTLVAAIGLCSP